MVVGFAGLEDVTSSLTVTPVVCVYQPTISQMCLQYFSQQLPCLPGGHPHQQAGGPHPTLFPPSAHDLLHGHGEDRAVCLPYLWTVHAGYEQSLG